MLKKLVTFFKRLVLALLLPVQRKFGKWYRRAWLFWPLKFVWVNLKYIKRIWLFPYKAYKKLRPFSRVFGIASPILVLLFLLLITKTITKTDLVTYREKVYASYDCEVQSNNPKTFVAGQNISLEYLLPCFPNIPLTAVVQTSYGPVILTESVREGKVVFTLPDGVSEKIGATQITLSYGEKVIYTDDISITTATEKIDFIESYFGPRIILAGGRDFTMLTVVPVDSYDNPMPDDTDITVNENFKEVQSVHELQTQDYVAYKRFYSYTQTGKITVSMTSDNGVTTKEKTTDVYPFSPDDFTIYQSKEHNFADGNEVVTLKTERLLDIYGNELQNGTIVRFLITTDSGKKLSAFAKTVKGVATTKIQHPVQGVNWTVQAFVPGLAESNTLEISFKSITQDFPVSFLNKDRTILVGPITSYMGQLVPNGTEVVLTVRAHGKEKEVVQYTVGGTTEFILRDFYYPPGEYQFKIALLGLEKQFTKTLTDE